MEQPTETITNEEKTFALLSHLSVLIGGIILPIIIWATQKEKSKFVQFHSLQSIFFHISYAVILAVLIVAVVLFFLAFGVGFGMVATHGHNQPATLPIFIIIITVAIYAGILLTVLGVIGYSIYLAIKSYKGLYIKVPIIGNIIYKKIFGETP